MHACQASFDHVHTIGTSTLGSPAPHVFRTLFGRTAKTKLWLIRHWSGEAHSVPSICQVRTKHFVFMLSYTFHPNLKPKTPLTVFLLTPDMQVHTHPLCSCLYALRKSDKSWCDSSGTHQHRPGLILRFLVKLRENINHTNQNR